MRSRTARVVWCVATLCLVFGVTAAHGQDATPSYEIDYSGSPDTVIIEYDVFSELAKTSDEPLLRIYGDGRVHVHRQPFRTDEGDYSMHLSGAELADLLQTFHESGAISYDAQGVSQQVRAAKAARAQAVRSGNALFQERSDVELTVIRLNLEAYRPSPVAARQTDIQKEIRRPDLQHQAEEFPQVEALSGLATVETQLKQVANDPRLRRVGGAR